MIAVVVYADYVQDAEQRSRRRGAARGASRRLRSPRGRGAPCSAEIGSRPRPAPLGVGGDEREGRGRVTAALLEEPEVVPRDGTPARILGGEIDCAQEDRAGERERARIARRHEREVASIEQTRSLGVRGRERVVDRGGLEPSLRAHLGACMREPNGCRRLQGEVG